MKDRNDSKNILHVMNIFFSLSYLGDQFKHFAKKGYKQHLICSHSPQLAKYANEQGLKYSEVEVSRKISPFVDLISLFKISRYILANKIEIVVGHTPKGALLAMLAAYILRVPKRVYFRHGLVYETMQGFAKRVMINIDRITAYCATDIVCVSPSLAKKSLLDNLNPEKKQIVLGRGTCGGIDAYNKYNPEKTNKEEVVKLRSKLGIDEKTFVIGFCGRLVKDKGIIELVEGFNLLKSGKADVKLKLLLIGDFEERDTLPNTIKQEIASNPDIICTGFIFESIERYYALMDIFILPSHREGFGMVNIEASSMEIPVLTTRATGCIDSIIAGITGFYVENTPESIAEKIAMLMNDRKIKQYGINGRKMVLEYYDNHIIWEIIETKVYS